MEGERPGGEQRESNKDWIDDVQEAEHMAHAMDPHYTRARKIDRVAEEGLKVTLDQERDEREQALTSEQYEAGDEQVRAQAQEEAASAVHRTVHVDDELHALDDAAAAARKAGDAAGELASQVYRRKRRDTR